MYDVWKKSIYTEVESEDSPNQYYAKKVEEILIVIPATEKDRDKFEEYKAEDYGNQDYNYQVKYKRLITTSKDELKLILSEIEKAEAKQLERV